MVFGANGWFQDLLEILHRLVWCTPSMMWDGGIYTGKYSIPRKRVEKIMERKRVEKIMEKEKCVRLKKK